MTFSSAIKLDRNCKENGRGAGTGAENICHFLCSIQEISVCFFFSDDKKEVVSSEKFGPAQTEPREVRNAEEKSESKLEGKHCPSSTEQMCIHMHMCTHTHRHTHTH